MFRKLIEPALLLLIFFFYYLILPKKKMKPKQQSNVPQRDFWSERRSYDLIVHEICLSCISRGLETTDAMAKLAIASIVIDPKYKYFELNRSRRDDIHKITDLAVNYIMSKTGLDMKLFMVQAYFTKDFGGQAHVLNEHRKLMGLYAEPLLQNVARYESKGSEEDCAAIFRQIVMICVLLTGMGNPTQPEVYREAEAAVSSLLSVNDVTNFLKLARVKKISRLKEIVKLVAGIRLFNKAREAGGKGVDDCKPLPALLTKACAATRAVLTESLARLMVKVTSLERSIEECFEFSGNLKTIYYTPSGKMTEEEFRFAKRLLTLWQQVALIIRMMIIYVNVHRADLYLTEDEMLKLLYDLVEDLRCRVAVPSKSVFPRFLNLHVYWKTFQNMMVLISVYNRMLKQMLDYAKVDNIPLAVQNAMMQSESSSDKTDTVKIEPSYVGCEVQFPSETDDFVLEFGGFCVVHCLFLDGVVLQAKRKIGVLKFRGLHYGFRNPKAAFCFGQNPERFIQAAVDFARKRPEYIDILQVRHLLSETQNLTGDLPKNIDTHPKVAATNEGVQTADHPDDEHWDYSYSHSVWHYKKLACKFTDLRNCKSQRDQTNLSHYRREAHSLTIETRVEGTQTMRDNCTNVPKLQNYMFGLRGRRDEVQHMIHLTRPVHEGGPLLDFVQKSVDCSSGEFLDVNALLQSVVPDKK